MINLALLRSDVTSELRQGIRKSNPDGIGKLFLMGMICSTGTSTLKWQAGFDQKPQKFDQKLTVSNFVDDARKLAAKVVNYFAPVTLAPAYA